MLYILLYEMETYENRTDIENLVKQVVKTRNELL